MASKGNNDDLANRIIYSSEVEDKEVSMGHKTCRYAGQK